MSWNEIGERLCALRVAKNLTQEQVANAIHTGRANYAKMEAGERDLKTEHCIALASFFGVSCDYLLRGIETNNIEPSKQYGLSNDALTHLHTLAEAAQNEANGWHEKDLLVAMNALLDGKADYALQLIYTFLTTNFFQPQLTWPADIDLGDKADIVKSLHPTLAFQKRTLDGKAGGYFIFPYDKAFEEAFLLHINDHLKQLKAQLMK